MKLITVGDNVTDCYLDERVYFPGGQAVNVAVDAKRDGADEVAYLGVFGDDDRAEYIREVLSQEGVSTERCRKVYAHTAQPGVRLVDGERTFLSGPRDSCQHLFALNLVREDLAMLKGFDVCHTTNNSNIEGQLAALAGALPVSFDFSVDRDPAYLDAVCPHVTYAFLSGDGLDEQGVRELAHSVLARGCKVAVVTMGKAGSFVATAGQELVQPVCPVEAVDTMGAGDAFAAAFLVSYVGEGDLAKAAAFAAERAAYTCTLRGGFGHPHAF